MISTDQLFEEDFKPQWMVNKERRERESLFEAIQVKTDFQYRQAAKEKNQRIIDRFPPKNPIVPKD